MKIYLLWGHTIHGLNLFGAFKSHEAATAWGRKFNEEARIKGTMPAEWSIQEMDVLDE
jgi:hypothetical protein